MKYSLILLSLLSSRSLAAPALTSSESITSPSASLLADSETGSMVADTTTLASPIAPVNTFRKTTIQLSPTQVMPPVSSVSSPSAISTRQPKSQLRQAQAHSTAIYSRLSVSSAPAPHTTSLQQSKTVFRETSSKTQSVPTTTSLSIAKTTGSASSSTLMPHLGPGIVVRPSPSPTPTSAPEDSTHNTLIAETGDDQGDPHHYPAPVHKLIILLLIFLGFIGVACGFFALGNTKVIRALLCRSPKRSQPTLNEKDPRLPIKMRNSLPPPANSPRWLKLPTQIIGLSSPAPPPFRSPMTGRPRNRVIDITPNFPRSRFSDSSSEGTSSIYSDSSSLDAIVPNANGQEAVILPPSELFTRNSDVNVPVINVSNAPQQYLTVPRRDERWSLEAHRLSSISEAESSKGSVQGSEDRWSVEPQRISAYSDVSEATSVRSGRSETSDKDALLAVSRRMVETVRWGPRSGV